MSIFPSLHDALISALGNRLQDRLDFDIGFDRLGRDDDGDIDWGAYAKWADAYALEQLIEAPSYNYHEAVALGLVFHDPNVEEMVEEHAISPEDAPKVRELLDKIQRGEEAE